MSKEVIGVDLNKPYFATDYTHSLLSSCAYKTHNKGDKLQFAKSHKLKHNKYLENWHVEEVFSPSKSDDYYSALYLNPSEGYAVLAHRGTDIKGSIIGFNQSLKEDMIEILNRNIGVQQIAAYAATKAALEIIKEKNLNNDVGYKNYHFSLTGHSLGAWLAELSLFFCHVDFDYRDVKAVTFDSPGSHDHLDNFRSNIISDDTFFNHNLLDLTTYLSAPNLVNVCNRHLGQVYRVYPKISDPKEKIQEFLNEPPKKFAFIGKLYGKFKCPIDSTKFILDLVDSNKFYAYAFLSLAGHSLDPILAVFDEKTGLPVKYRKVADWPLLKHENSGSICAGEIGLVKAGASVANLIGIPEIIVHPASKLIAQLVPAVTTSSIMNVIAEFLSGNIQLVQIFETFKYLENGSQGYKEISPKDANEKFSMSYMAHYRTEDISLSKVIVPHFTKGKPEWYLKQIAKTNVMGLQNISSNTKYSLDDIKKHYSIELNNGVQSIVCKYPWTVNSLKNSIKILAEYDENLEQSLSVGNWRQSMRIPIRSLEKSQNKILSDLPNSIQGFVSRENIFKKIDDILSKNKIASISAFAGTGKSSTATEYGHLFDSRDNTLVFWISSETEGKIHTSYKKLATELGINFNQITKEVSTSDKHGIQSEERVLDNELMIRLVNRKIASSASEVLFIFDNVEKYSDIEECLSTLKNLSTTKILVTTRDRNLLNNSKLNIELEPFSKSEASDYINKNFGSRFDDDQVKSLVSFLCSKDNIILPHTLSKASAFLKEKKFWKISQYIEYRINNPDQNEDTMLFEQIANNNQTAWQILQYSALLDPDFINLEIFCDLLSVDLDDLQDVIMDLEKLSLVSLIQDKDKLGVKVHRLIQDNINQCFSSQSKLMINKDSLINNLIATFSNIIPLVDVNPDENWQIAGELYPHAKQLIEQSDIVKTEEAAILYSKLAEYQNLVNRNYDSALYYQNKALLTYQDLFGTDHFKVADTYNKIANIMRSQGNYEEALDYVEKAQNIFTKYYPNNLIVNSKILYEKSAILFFFKDRLDESLKLAFDALEMQHRLYNFSDHVDVARSLNLIMCIYSDMGKNKAELEYGLRALEMKSRLYSGDHPELAMSLNNVGYTYKVLGNYKEALNYYNLALKMRIRLYKNHEDIIQSLNNIASTYKNMGKYEEALNYFKEALQIRKQMYQGDHKNMAYSLDNIGDMYYELGDNKKALNYYNQAMGMRQRMYPDGHSDIVSSWINFIYSVESNNLKMHYAFRALQMAKKVHGDEDHEDVSLVLRYLGAIYANMGDLQNSLKYMTEGLEVRKRLYKNDSHPEIVEAMSTIAEICDSLGDHSASMRYKLQILAAVQEQEDNKKFIDALEELGLTFSKINYDNTAFKIDCNVLGMRQKFCSDNNLDIDKSLNKIKYDCNELKKTYRSKYSYKADYYSSIYNFLKNKSKYNGPIINAPIIKISKIADTIENVNKTIIANDKKMCEVLNNIAKASEKGNWSSGLFISRATSVLGDWGVKGYIDKKFLMKTIGGSNGCTRDTLDIVKMLCFEAICLGISCQETAKRNYKCLDEFVKIYPDVANKVLISNPEYFIDENILKYCKKYLSDKDTFNKIDRDVGEFFCKHKKNTNTFEKVNLLDLIIKTTGLLEQMDQIKNFKLDENDADILGDDGSQFD